eukprot:TRINITY_DN7923_c0_g1_i1.p1 TRINITY_DN7923_c0_g1~~TRINITY_DN7923_c0_g1_i1.p1  ORF type:complete len:459 (-),score=55.53 TRINITY_DN7923_c0_g1_i1:116-1492(-)
MQHLSQVGMSTVERLCNSVGVSVQLQQQQHNLPQLSQSHHHSSTQLAHPRLHRRRSTTPGPVSVTATSTAINIGELGPSDNEVSSDSSDGSHSTLYSADTSNPSAADTTAAPAAVSPGTSTLSTAAVTTTAPTTGLMSDGWTPHTALLCAGTLILGYTYWRGVLSLGAVWYTAHRCNTALVEQFRVKLGMVQRTVVVVLCVLLVTVCVSMQLFRDEQIGATLSLLPAVRAVIDMLNSTSTPAQTSSISSSNPQLVAGDAAAKGFLASCWLGLMCVLIVKCLVMACKALLALGLAWRPAFRGIHRGKGFALLEGIGSLYCMLVPLSVWCTYISEQGFPAFLRLVILVLYLGSYKFRLLVDHCSNLAVVARRSLRSAPPFGSYVSPLELQELGENGECTICREVVTDATVKLSCNHCFCEDCITSWLERKRECPLCRAQVTVPGGAMGYDGTTSVWASPF